MTDWQSRLDDDLLQIHDDLVEELNIKVVDLPSLYKLFSRTNT